MRADTITALMQKLAIATAAVAAVMVAPSASATATPAARLISCGQDSCLLVSGRRAHESAEVRINGHVVAVEGQEAWKVRLPVDTVRDWSAPMARTIDITVVDAGSRNVTKTTAALPIGLLGHVTELAYLMVGAR